jgi:hypothetical protein
MALAKGTNSYATVAEADAYFADRIDVAAWLAASPEQKAQALITASKWLDDMNWAGTAISESQSLAFPRMGQYFDPRLGTFITYDGVTVPNRVIQAVYELAYHMINNDGVLDDSGGVKSLTVGPISLNFIEAPAKIPPTVKRVIKPLLVNAGSSAWWRAN